VTARRGVIGLLCTAATVLVFSVTGSSAGAQQPPRPGCVAVPKDEYKNATKYKRLFNRFGAYSRTGPLWRRDYWYCGFADVVLPTTRFE
jgi:hypothetical protein